MKLTAYLLVYLGIPLLASIVPNETFGAVAVIIYIFLLIPFGILRLIDFYRTNDGSTPVSRVFNAVFRVPLALFGFVCLVAGVSIIGWVLYNIFVQRQKEYTGPRHVFGWGSFGVAVPLVVFGWLMLRSVARRKPDVTLTPEEQAEFDHEEDDEEQAADAQGKAASQNKRP